MSRSSKDGARGGGHRDYKREECWSRRCPRATGMRKRSGRRSNRHGCGYKDITHRYERRTMRQALEHERRTEGCSK